MSNYTKPKLRKKIVQEVLCGSKGGKTGQWSARKAQLARMLYEQAGGGYRGEKTPQQKKLTTWTGQKWTTRDGGPAIRKDSNGRTVTKRYLPADVWDALSEYEARETDRKKVKGSKEGKQFVATGLKRRRSRRR